MEGTNVTTGSNERLARVIANVNGKGGVGKTSTAANMGGEMAAGGLKVLLVDADISGNLAIALGFTDHPDNDRGKGTVQTVWGTGDLTVIRDVRERLDVIPGGKHLKLISKISGDSRLAEDLPGGAVGPAFAEALAALVEKGRYDVVIIDCPPEQEELQEMALTAARYVLVLTKADPYGWEGLLELGPTVKRVRGINPKITYLGAVLFGHQPGATRIMRETQAALDQVSDKLILLDSYIRHSYATAHDAPRRGQLARELARDAKELNSERAAAFFAAKKAQRDGSAGEGNVLELPPAGLSGTAKDVAGDYAKLAREVLTRIATLEQQQRSATAGAAAGNE